MKENRVILFRGFFGDVFSTGMDKLAVKLEKLPCVDDVKVHAYEEWFTVYEALKKSHDNIVLIGHSFGALSSYKIATVLNKKSFPLIVSFDYSPYYSCIAHQVPDGVCPNNVVNALNFYQKIDPLVKGVVIKRADGTEKNIVNHKAEYMHCEIDKVGELHDEVIKHVKYNL